MLKTTLCYLEKDGEYLMMHRIKKSGDLNHDKWIGVGGKFLDNETPFQCAEREIKEETGLTVTKLNYRGIIHFISNEFGEEEMHLFTSTEFYGKLNADCDEGNLVWINKQAVLSLPIWEGDKIFFKLLNENAPFFRLKLRYHGDRLIDQQLNFIKGANNEND